MASSLLTSKTVFWQYLGEQYGSTATGGATTSLTDSTLIGYTSETWPTKIVGQQIRITSGSATGDLRMVGKFDPSDGIIYPNRSFSAAVASTDTYELWGTAINGGQPLTDLFNAVRRQLRYRFETQVTIVTNQREYGLTMVESRHDVKGVYVRLLDASGVEPYRVHELAVGVDWWAYDRVNAADNIGAMLPTLELTSALTFNTSVNELWIIHDKTPSGFSTDATVLDLPLNYEWLAWEAVYELSRRKLSLGTGDRARWQGLQERAAQELAVQRGHWVGSREPVAIATWP